MSPQNWRLKSAQAHMFSSAGMIHDSSPHGSQSFSPGVSRFNQLELLHNCMWLEDWHPTSGRYAGQMMGRMENGAPPQGLKRLLEEGRRKKVRNYSNDPDFMRVYYSWLLDG